MLNLSTKDWYIDNIETVIFDKDGTFIDLHYFWGKMTELRALEVIKYYNITSTNCDTLCNFLGYDITNGKMLSDGITALYSRSKIIEIFKANLEDIGVIATKEELEHLFDKVSTAFYENMQKYTKPINEAIEFIKKLHARGIKLGIVTADSVTSTNLTLKQFGWEEYFDVVIGRESSTSTKESGIPTIMALEKLNAHPKTTVMIGDSPTDMISAKNAGIESTILVATGQISADELKKHSLYVTDTLCNVIINN